MNLDELAKKYGGSPVQSGSSKFDELAQKYGGVAAESVATPERKSTIGSELVRGGKQLASSVRTGFGALTGSPEEAAIAGVARGQAIGEEAGEGASLEAVKRAYQERGLLSAAGEVASQIPRALAGQVPQLAAMAGGAKLGAMAGTAVAPGPGTVVGGVLGAGATLLPQFFGSNIERQAAEQMAKDEQVKIDRGAAGAAAAGQAAIEGAGTAFVLGKRIVKGVLGVADDAALASTKAQQAMTKAAERSLAAAAGRGVAKGAVVEIPVEIAQSVLERAQAGLDVTSPEALTEYGEVAYQAGLVGGAIGAGAGPVDTAMARQGVKARTAFEEAEAKRTAEAERARLEAEDAEKAKAPPLALGGEGAFTPVALPDGSVAMTREELAQYEEQQFQKKYEPQAVPPEPIFEEEPVGKSITETKPRLEESPVGGELASIISGRRETEEAKAEVPLDDDYAFLQREKQRLLQQDQTPDTKRLIGRIDERIGEVLKRDIERQRADAEAAKTSVFAQEQLPEVESRDVVVGNRELEQLQAAERLPDEPLTGREVKNIEKMRTAPPPVPDAQARLEQAEMDRRKFMRSKDAKQGNLMKYLEGKLALDEVSDIAPKGKGFEKLANEKGTYISELVSDGMLDEFLPPDQRAGQANFDAQQAAETIKENLRNKVLQPFDTQTQIRQLDDSIAAAEREAKEPSTVQFDLSEVEPGEAATVERAAGDQAVVETTDQIRYKRATGKVGIGKQAVQDTVDTVKARWANAPEVVVAENMDDPAIPQEVRDHNKEAVAKGAKGSPQGFYYKGKAYVIADSIGSTNEAVEALMHEALGHFGLRGVFGPKMETVLRDVIKNRRAEVESKAEQYGLDPKSDKDMLEAAEEVLAVMAQTKPGLPFVKRAIAIIRNFLRDLGFDIKMSDADIIQKYILPARAFVESGKGRPTEGKPAATRKEAETEDVRYSREGVMERPAAEPEAGQPKPSRQNIFGDPVLGTWSIQVDPKMELQDGLIYKMLDKNIDVKRIVEAVKKTGKDIAAQWNPYLQEELYHGRTANAALEFQDKEWLPLLKDMEAKGVTIGELEKYLHNRHAEDYNKLVAKRNPNRPEMQDGGSGIATEDARKYLAGLDADTKAKYDELAARVDGITKGTRKLLADTGYEKAERIKAWEEAFPNYVPLMREEGDFDYNFGSFGTGRGFDVRRDFSRSAMGSKRNVVDIIGNVIAARNNAIALTEKNRVAQAVYGLALEAPNPDFWMAINPEAEKVPEDAIDELRAMGLDEEAAEYLMKEPKQRVLDPKKDQIVSRINTKLRENYFVLATRINGENRYVFFNPKDPRSKRAATALKNLDAQDLGTALGMAAKVTRWMAAVNTQYNPIFGPYNFMRDMQAAALQLSTTELAGQQKEVAANVVPSLRVIYSTLRKRRKGEKVEGEMADLWKEFQKEGGQTGFRDNFSRTQDRTEALLDEMSKLTEGKLMAGGRAVKDWLSDYNDSLENAVRLSAYKVAKEKFKKEGFSDSEAKQKAASLAKNLTVNFNRKGDIATQMGALYAFFNAAMQGTARMIETLKGPMGKKIMAGGLLLGSMQAALMAAAGFDDEEPPEFVRSKNIVIPTGDGNYVAFPMPLGFHVIPGISRILTEWTLSGFDDTARRVTDLTGLFLDAFNPIGNAGWSVQTVTPTFLDPFVALGENKDWTGKPISKEDIFSLRPTPGYTRAREGANWLAKEVSEFLNYASGGTKYQPGVLSPTPEQLEYLVGQVFGGVGREAIKLTTTIDKTITGEDLPPYKIPLYGRFVGETKSSAAESNRFYKNMERLNRLDLEVKGRREDKEPVGDFMRENPETRLLPLANKTYKDVQALRKRRAALLERGAPKESIQAVENMITRRMQVLNDRVKAMKQ